MDALLVHPDVKAVSFVFSPRCQLLYEPARARQRVQALAGPRPHGVMPDADLDQRLMRIGSVYGSAGARAGDFGGGAVVMWRQVIPSWSSAKALKVLDCENLAAKWPLVTQTAHDRIMATSPSLRGGAKLLVDLRGSRARMPSLLRPGLWLGCRC